MKIRLHENFDKQQFTKTCIRKNSEKKPIHESKPLQNYKKKR